MTVAAPELLWPTFSDTDLESAAEETAAAYTFQTSSYYGCCN